MQLQWAQWLEHCLQNSREHALHCRHPKQDEHYIISIRWTIRQMVDALPGICSVFEFDFLSHPVDLSFLCVCLVQTLGEIDGIVHASHQPSYEGKTNSSALGNLVQFYSQLQWAHWVEHCSQGSKHICYPSLGPLLKYQLKSVFRSVWWYIQMLSWWHTQMLSWWHIHMLSWWHIHMLSWWHIQMLSWWYIQCCRGDTSNVVMVTHHDHLLIMNHILSSLLPW